MTDESNLKPREIREKLLRATFELIAEKGIDGVSVREIVERVNVSKPVLYYYFKDKEDLCAQLFEQIKLHVQDLYSEKKAANLTVREIIIEKLNHELRDMKTTPAIAKMILRTLSSDKKDRLGQLMCDINSVGRDLIIKLFTQAEQRGEIKKGSAVKLAFMMHAISLHVLLLGANGQLCELPSNFSEEMADTILQGFAS